MEQKITKHILALNSKHRVLRPFFGVIKKLERNPDITEVEAIEKSLSDGEVSYTRVEIVKFLQDLAKAGCGKFVVGRRGGESRLEWQIDARELAKIILDRLNFWEGSDRYSSTETLIHRFILRPNFVITLELPVDISSIEVQRLEQFLRSLPMNPTS